MMVPEGGGGEGGGRGRGREGGKECSEKLDINSELFT